MHEISNNVVCATSKASDQPAHARSLNRAFASRLSILGLLRHHLEFLSLKGGCRGSSDSVHVKMPHCWKSHSLADYYVILCYLLHGSWKNNFTKTKQKQPPPPPKKKGKKPITRSTQVAKVKLILRRSNEILF